MTVAELIEKLQAEIKKLQSQLAEKDEIVQKILKSVIPERTGAELLKKLEAEEDSLLLELADAKTTDDNIKDILEFSLAKLRNLAETLKSIKDQKTRFRFQKWLFPAGLQYDGEKFGTTVLPSVLQIRKTALAGVSDQKFNSGRSGWNRTSIVSLEGICPIR